MSSSSSESGNDAKVAKLRSRAYFPVWKQKMLSAASSKGYDKYLTLSVAIKTQAEIDAKEVEYINEPDEKDRRVKKGEWAQMKRERKKSLEAADMLISSVRSKDLKMLVKCKGDPKAMFERICKKYGTEEDTDLTDLLEDFNECVLKSKRHDPEDWYAELEQINEHLEEIDTDFAKSEKEVAAHIINNLPKGYSAVKTIIQMDDQYLNDVEKLKKQITKHWKTNFRKKGKKKKKDSSSESDSDESTDDDKRKSGKRKDEFALNISDKHDRRNQYGVIICGHCGKPGHGVRSCWEVHGRPSEARNRSTTNNARPPRKCWNCGSTEHLAHQCTKGTEGNDDNGDEKDQLNNLFVGSILQDGNDELKKKWYYKLPRNAFFKARYGVVHERDEAEHVMMKTDEHDKKEGSEWSLCGTTTDSDHQSNSDTDIDLEGIEEDGNIENNVEWCKVDEEGESESSDDDDEELTLDQYVKKVGVDNYLKMILGIDTKHKSKDEQPSINVIFTENVEVNNVHDDKEWEVWLGDTGASCHVTHTDNNLFNTVKGTNDKIVVGDQRKCIVMKKGDLVLRQTEEGLGLPLEDVRVVHEIGKNILSIGTLLRNGGKNERQ